MRSGCVLCRMPPFSTARPTKTDDLHTLHRLVQVLEFLEQRLLTQQQQQQRDVSKLDHLTLLRTATRLERLEDVLHACRNKGTLSVAQLGALRAQLGEVRFAAQRLQCASRRALCRPMRECMCWLIHCD
jgi:hypothetical protein